MEPTAVSFNNNHQSISSVFPAAIDDGIILIKDLKYNSLIDDVEKIFDKLRMPKNQKIIEDLNNAYAKNLVFKDATKSQLSGIDQKRSLDLSPHRISIINKENPLLLSSIGTELSSTLSFLDTMCTVAVPRILSAICEAAQIAVDAKKINFNYRMLDYYESANDLNNKCGEHRDFGLFTLIFQDETGGLQMQRNDGKWYDIEADGQSVICLFGWCAQILSNGRIKATNHRVVAVGNGKRRKSAVLFVAPNHDQILSPFVGENEQRIYADVKVETLRERMRDAWKMREGTLSKQKSDLIKKTMKQQADIVHDIKL